MIDDDWSDDELDDYADFFAPDCDRPEDLRGTSQCDGTCDPQCSWCLVLHVCPDECAGGACPYDDLKKRESNG